MSLRKRLTLIAATSVGAAVLIAVVVCYMVVRAQLGGQVGDSLNAQAQAVESGDLHAVTQPVPSIPASAGGPAQYVQIVLADGSVHPSQGNISLPVDARTLVVAAGDSGSYQSDIHVGGNHLREITFPYLFTTPEGQSETGAIQPCQSPEKKPAGSFGVYMLVPGKQPLAATASAAARRNTHAVFIVISLFM